MDKRIKVILICSWILALSGIVVFLNPKIFGAKSGDTRRQFTQTPVMTHPFFIKEADVHSAQANPESIYRGNPQRTGVYHLELPYLMLRRTWRIDPFNHELHQASKSTPVHDGENIFVGDDFGHMSSIGMDGKIRWQYVSNSDRGVHGSAAVIDNTVFWGDYAGILYAADKITGKLQWLNHLGDTIGSSPLYSDKQIYISVETFHRPNGFVAKLDARNGQIIWLSPFLGAQAHSSPTLSEDKSTIYVGSNNGFLTALDAQTGAIRWRYQTGEAIKGTAAVLHDAVYFCSWDSFMYKLSSKGNLVWRTLLGGACQSSVTFSEQYEKLYVATKNGDIQALNLNTGHIEWFYKGEGLLLSSGVLVLDKNKSEVLVMACESHKVCIFNPQNGKILSAIKTDTMVTSVPMIFERSIFLSMNGRGGLGRWK